MNLNKSLLFGAAVLALVACSDDDGPSGTRGPTALVRWVHVVPDTMRANLIVVDDPLENLPAFHGISFRNSSGLYQQVVAGERTIRIFPDTTNAAYSTQRLIDTTVTLTAGSRYTLVYAGNARGNQDYLMVFEDDRPEPSDANIAVRAIHAARGAADVDVHVAASTVADPVADPATSFTGLAYLDASEYDELPVLTGTALYQFAVTDAGAATLRVSPTVSPNVPGAAPTSSVSAQAGVRQGGSVLTAIYTPGAVAGSFAAQGNSTTPTVILLRDNVPGT